MRPDEQSPKVGPVNVSEQWKDNKVGIGVIGSIPLYFMLCCYFDRNLLPPYYLLPLVCVYTWIPYHSLITPIPRHAFIGELVCVTFLINMTLLCFHMANGVLFVNHIFMWTCITIMTDVALYIGISSIKRR